MGKYSSILYLCRKFLPDMTKIFYHYTKPESATLQWAEQYGFSKILSDSVNNERSRPGLREALNFLKSGDELIIPNLATTVRGTFQISTLIAIAYIKCIRLISIEDRIDSGGLLFPDTHISDFITKLSNIPMEIQHMQREAEYGHKLGNTPAASSRKYDTDVKSLAINMYLSGFKVTAILKETGMSKTWFYKILRRNGIAKLHRHR